MGNPREKRDGLRRPRILPEVWHEVLALVYPGMALLDRSAPCGRGFLPGYEVQYAWHRPGAVLTDCGLGVEATHSFDDAWTDPDVLMVGGGAKPTLDLLGDSAAIAFLADRGSRARWVCSVCTGSLLLGAAGLLRGYRASVLGRAGRRQFGAGSATTASASIAIASLVTASRRVSTSYRCGRALVRREHGATDRVDHGYAPQPPYRTGRPDLRMRRPSPRRRRCNRRDWRIRIGQNLTLPAFHLSRSQDADRLGLRLPSPGADRR
jgi:cyclohexyl-isocyanide hydratase